MGLERDKARIRESESGVSLLFSNGKRHQSESTVRPANVNNNQVSKKMPGANIRILQRK